MAEQMQHDINCSDAVASILEANGLGNRSALASADLTECACDDGGNRLLLAEVGNRRYFVTLSPALKGRLVGEDRIEDEEVRLHFGVNVIGNVLSAKQK